MKVLETCGVFYLFCFRNNFFVGAFGRFHILSPALKEETFVFKNLT